MEIDFARKLSFLVFLLCVLISLKNQNAETRKGTQSASWSFSSTDPPASTSPSNLPEFFTSDTEMKLEDAMEDYLPLQYDFYQESCPNAERIIRSAVHRLHKLTPEEIPGLLRLVFHDCFIEGCDASVLLDPGDDIDSEKESPPNHSLKGFDVIDTIKQELEEECPGTVSCADILVLAAREAVILVGGPFYPLQTGRRDSVAAFPEIASLELPSPHDDLPTTIASFGSKGFDQRETVSLLGAHSTGIIHCEFFIDRLYNFGGINSPDPSIDTEFLKILRSRCNDTHSSSLHSSVSTSPAPSISTFPQDHCQEFEGLGCQKTEHAGPESIFGTIYYRNLLQGKGILYVDQQLTAGEETEAWVRAYAADFSLFRRDFASAMLKLSSNRVLTAPIGQIRLDCRRVLSETES